MTDRASNGLTKATEHCPKSVISLSFLFAYIFPTSDPGEPPVPTQAMYPEIMRFIFVINAPLAAAAFWKVLAPFLDPVVREKVHIWGPREWRREISGQGATDADCCSIDGSEGLEVVEFPPPKASPYLFQVIWRKLFF